MTMAEGFCRVMVVIGEAQLAVPAKPE